ncbi:MAG: acyltransferase family protein [Pseudomonadota bacterium]
MPTGKFAGIPISQRHYGLDWLRIAAFALLIVYHVAMVFGPWDWIIKTPHRIEWLTAPMALLTPWRLALLFAVSGYASQKLLARQGDARAFVASRNRRLLIPLAFGMAVLVPPEMWVRVAENGYPHGFWHFWAFDYWRAGTFWGREFPSWEHLWFVVYLWAYTLILVGAITGGGARLARVGAAAVDWIAKGRRILWLPVAALATARLALLFVVPEQQGLFRDWSGHAQYLPLFIAGFALAARPDLWRAIARVRGAAAAIALVTGAVVVAVELTWPGSAVPPHLWMAADRAARSAMAWSMVLLLFDLAERRWNHDHRWRKPLAEAVFPFYLVHHAAIVVTAWYTLPLALSAGAEFAVLVVATSATCLVTYLVGRRIGWLRPLIGLSSQRQSTHAAMQALRSTR